MSRGVGADLRAAFLLLTRLPVPPGPSPSAAGWWAFPLVGAAVGLIGALAGWVVLAIGMTPGAAAIAALAATALATGAFHEDGLADCADGLGGGRDRAAKLAIMHDSRIGSYGALALILATLGRASALDQAAARGAGHLAATLVAGHALARLAPVLLRLSMPSARPDGVAREAGSPRPRDLAVAAGVALLVGVLTVGLGRTLAAALVMLVPVAVIGRLARRQLGGITGDVLGAAEQGGELACFFVTAP